MSVTERVLSSRELNRALLARQFLLGPRHQAGALEVVEHLTGMQAQAPFPPYFGLWSRIDGFHPGELADLLTGRQAVRIAVMRSTIHLVSARDCLALRRLLQPVIERGFRVNHGRRLGGVDLEELARTGRELVEAKPMTFGELGVALASRWPDHAPADLAQGVRALVPLVQVPPRAVWGKSGLARHTSAEAWLGSAGREITLRDLVRRYLAAFGPATVRDVQTWSGLTGLRAVVADMREELVRLRGEDGAELFDLPGAPRPPGDTPAPVRLVAEFDNLVLSHADRTRIIPRQHRDGLFTVNGVFPGTVLVDGFAAGIWRGPGTGREITIEMWEPVPRATRQAIAGEAERLLAFTDPAASGDVRITAPA